MSDDEMNIDDGELWICDVPRTSANLYFQSLLVELLGGGAEDFKAQQVRPLTDPHSI